MEKETDQDENLIIQPEYIADHGNNSIFVHFLNFINQIKSIIPKFNIHTDQSKISLSNPAERQGEFRETGIQTKLDNNIWPIMEVINTKSLSSETRNQKATGEPAKGEEANDVMEQKATLIVNPEPDIVGLVGPRYIKRSDSCLVCPRSNSEYINNSHSCAEQLAPIEPTPQYHKVNPMKTSLLSDLSCLDNKKILKFADVNTLKLATLIQTMMTDVLNLTQNVNDSQVSIEGFSFKVSVDIRKGKQEAIDSTDSNDKISSISKQLDFQFKDVLPAITNKEELNTVTTTRTEKQLQDEIFHDDQFLVVEEEQELSSLASSVCSDDTLTLENIISVVDLTCYDEFNKQELKSIDTFSLEELPQDETFYGDNLQVVEEEMPSMGDGGCSDDTLSLENRISIYHLTYSSEFNEQEEASGIEELIQGEFLHADELLLAEKEKMSSTVDAIYFDDTYTVENRISGFDFTCNDEFNKPELKVTATTDIEELQQDDILHKDPLLAVNENVEISRKSDGVCSKETLIAENIMSIQDLKFNDELPLEDETEISKNQLNLGVKQMVITDRNNELLYTTELDNEMIEIASTELKNKLLDIASIKWINELREIKSKDKVNHCSAIKLSDKKDSTIVVNETSPSEHSSLKIELSVSKYCSVSEDFLKLLSILNNTSNDGPLKSSVMVPAFYFRTWYFQNLRQGFLLNIMLKKANVSTLNYMRNLYFVIITTDTQSISIAINFALQNEIFLNFMEPSMYITGDCCKYTVSAKEVQQIFSPETGIVESCTTYAESSNNINIQSRSDLTSIYSTLLAEKINAATSYLYFGLFDELQKIDVAVGDSNFEFQSDINICDMDKIRCKTWLTSMLSVPKNEIGTLFIRDVNETVFEQFSVDRYMEAAFGKCNSSYFSSAANSNFYNIFFKCLGHTIACTMLSFFISML